MYYRQKQLEFFLRQHNTKFHFHFGLRCSESKQAQWTVGGAYQTFFIYLTYKALPILSNLR